ncbi:ATP-dependent protease HslVU (ClpYQ), peptidase subunit [Formivibrio citricus]|uniref:ATP-dependent protease HslVU (ClpYQ), peptidase subunit n=1 Tax=Formivibrio citricus TaxID=83765 RepID=A0A1I5BBI6_9NEIS|nr:MFS transporter [Formivibrio citricus]SFN71899.1 ATP-dependent protease HslVU (ClpYQ), peptidase subunit [Formivibrio citricus]
MTTVVVVRKGDEVAIAADSQSTFGDTKMSARDDGAWDKIFGACGGYFSISGSAAHDLVLQAALGKVKKLDFSSRAAIFDSFRRLHPKLKEDFFLKTEEDEDDPYESSQMTVLLANSSGIYGVYSLREVYEYKRFWAIGSGSDFAIGAMQAVYDNPAFSAEDIARIGVEVGCAFDVSSSLPMTCYSMQLESTREE